MVIPRDQHNISRANISGNALKVLYRLRDAGYQAFLVGGGVRDLLLGREPKDFDVATDAVPEEVKAVFRNCRLIGRRFRLAHVHFGREVIEVATFRGQSNGAAQDEGTTENGMLMRDNVYGTLEEDAFRRDFSVNALYYNIDDFSVIDHVGGLPDLRTGVLRLIGDPEARYREDPVRMLRAVRFAAKLGLRIQDGSADPITGLAPLLADVPAARLFEEVLKLFMAGTAVAAFEKLRQFHLFGELFPMTEAALAAQQADFPLTLVRQGLENTDARIAAQKPVTPAFLFAVLLWEPVRARWEHALDAGEAPHPALQRAAAQVLEDQVQSVSLPKRFSIPMREIWSLQPRFETIRGRRPGRLASHPRFRAAYDFLLLRAESGEADPELAQWWTEYQVKTGMPDGDAATDESTASPARKRRRRRRRRQPAAQ